MVKRKIDPKNRQIYEMQATLCHALAHPVRQEILDLLADGELANSELLEALEIPKANLSLHLNLLKQAGIVTVRREGLYQFVSIALPQVKAACSMVRSVLLEKLSREGEQSAQLKKRLSKS